MCKIPFRNFLLNKENLFNNNKYPTGTIGTFAIFSKFPKIQGVQGK